MSFIESIGEQAAGQVTGAILGLALGKHNDNRQYEQQERLQNLQIKGSKELTDYNTMKQLQMWKDTSYEAQKEQMKLAGINPGLMYGMGGGGGQSSNVSQGSVSGGQAPVGGREIQDMIGMGIQLQLLKAQKENIEADTALKQADTANKPIQGENIKAQTSNLMQGLDNLREDYEIKRLQQTMMNIENYEKQTSQADRLDTIEYNARIALRSLQTLKNEGKISDQTVQDKITIVQQSAIASMLHNELTKSNIQVNEQQIKESANKIMQGWDTLSNEMKKTRLQETMTQYNTTIDKWTEKGLDILEQAVDGVLRKR